MGSIEVGARGGEVSRGLALVLVVAAEVKAGGEEVGSGEAGDSPNFIKSRHKFHSYPSPTFYPSPFSSLFILSHRSDKFQPETLSTA